MAYKTIEQIRQERIRFLKRFGINSPEEFQNAVKAARESLGFSFLDMSNWLRCTSAASLCRWERGITMPRNKAVIERLIEKNILMRQNVDLR